MRRLFLGILSLLGVALATWGSQENAKNQAAPGRSGAAPAGVADEGKASGSLPSALGALHPRISPDGEQIVFSYQGAIWRIPRVGGAAIRLTEGEGLDVEPVWSPNGKQVAFVSSAQMRGGELRLVDVATRELVSLPSRIFLADSGTYSKVDFSPDGRVFGNLRAVGQPVELALVDPATGKFQTLMKAPPQSRFALSRSGSQIAYAATMDTEGQQGGNDGPQADLWKMPTTGGKPVRITRFPSRIHDLCWSEGDKALLVVSDLGGAHNDLWRIPLDDPERGARRITSGQADEERPSVSADGRFLVYSDNRAGATAIVVRDLRSGIDTTVPIAALDFGRQTGIIRLHTKDKKTGAGVVARIVVIQERGKPSAPPGALYRIHGDNLDFYCSGDATWTLPAGRYRLQAFHGPEYRQGGREFTVAAGGETELTVELERWTNPAERGWYSGENHIHANYGYGEWYNTPETMLAQCAGEDLRICNFMVANSNTDGVFDREFFRGRPDPLSTAETILYWNQEFRSTSWGHMTLLSLDRLVEPIFTGFKDTTNPWDVPTNADIAERTRRQQGLANYTHVARNIGDPYLGAYSAKGLPVDVALGVIDTLDLNGAYAASVALWYRLLNCGFRLPPSAGTDCFLNRINSQLPGADRVYVRIDGAFSYKSWIDALRAGRSFVTNGPLIELTIEDKGPGDVIRLAAPRDVRVVAKVSSQFALTEVSLVHNGKTVARGRMSTDRQQGTIDAAVAAAQSGWYSLRAFASNQLEANSAPIYVEIADKPTASREDAEFFLKWIDRLAIELRVRDRTPDPQAKEHIEAQLEAARRVYVKIAERAE